MIFYIKEKKDKLRKKGKKFLFFPCHVFTTNKVKEYRWLEMQYFIKEKYSVDSTWRIKQYLTKEEYNKLDL